MQPQECLVSSARYSFWARSGHTRHVFRSLCSENGGKTSEGDGFLTVASEVRGDGLEGDRGREVRAPCGRVIVRARRPRTNTTTRQHRVGTRSAIYWRATVRIKNVMSRTRATVARIIQTSPQPIIP